jgi:hypothetical protein
MEADRSAAFGQSRRNKSTTADKLQQRRPTFDLPHCYNRQSYRFAAAEEKFPMATKSSKVNLQTTRGSATKLTAIGSSS